MEDKKLLTEIHQMLCKICSYIDKIESPEYIQKSEEKEFLINVAADFYVAMMEEIKHENNRRTSDKG